MWNSAKDTGKYIYWGDTMSNKLDLEEIADNLIDLGIENEWCDIERADVEWCIGSIIDDILQIINKKIIINDNGVIERR